MNSVAITLLAAAVALVTAQLPLDIPIFGPLGGLRLTPGADGKYGVGLHSGLNIGGNGFEKEFNFVGGPGTFETGSNGGVLVNGKTYGPNTQLGISRQHGTQFGSDLGLGRTQYENPSNMLVFGGPQAPPPPPRYNGIFGFLNPQQ